MRSFRKTILCSIAFSMMLWMGEVQQLKACAVCFGDPESDMARGAVAGMIVLASIVGFVLMGIAGTGLYWVHRSRQLHEHQNFQP